MELLAAGDRDAVSTRAVCAAADVQTPTIYRHFGDMQGLLDAAVARCLENYLEVKRGRPREADPIEDLRRGWDLHVEFALTYPGIYSLLYGEPRTDGKPVAIAEGEVMLRGMVERIAKAGRLRVGVDRAVRMIHAACRGVALTLISTAAGERDEGMSTAVREAVFAAVVSDPAFRGARENDRPARRALALKAVLDESSVLTPGEQALMSEWLDRLAGAS